MRKDKDTPEPEDDDLESLLDGMTVEDYTALIERNKPKSKKTKQPCKDTCSCKHEEKPTLERMSVPKFSMFNNSGSSNVLTPDEVLTVSRIVQADIIENEYDLEIPDIDEMLSDVPYLKDLLYTRLGNIGERVLVQIMERKEGDYIGADVSSTLEMYIETLYTESDRIRNILKKFRLSGME